MLNRLRDVFRCFEHHDVHYVVIGGIAAVLHGVPRATFDLDLLIEATLSNAQRLLAALAEAGFVTAELTTPASILEHVITVFKDRVRIERPDLHPGADLPGGLEQARNDVLPGPGRRPAAGPEGSRRRGVGASPRAAGGAADVSAETSALL